jgi:ABC-type multidrug transport system ATPase subunit/pSer/pThr/pTyr-binding forkhead associated (FHA) protein
MSDHLLVRVNGREAVFAGALGELTVGSGGDCEVRLASAMVRSRHLVILYDGTGWTVAAVDAVAATFRDGDPIDQIRVLAPVTLRLGDPVVGPALELAPATAELRDVTIDFGAHQERERREPATQPTSVPLTGDVLRIGRHPDSDIVVADVLVSRRHAEIRRIGEHRYEVVDRRSHNGTFVNGVRVEQAELEQLDVITIGHNSYRLVDSRLEEDIDTGEVAYAAIGLTVRLADGTVLLDRVGFSLDSRSMLGVIGPSGAGKSTLLGALTGFRMATEGDVRYGARSLYADYEALRRRIGYVPQDDVVHRELTVTRALEFAAGVRFPPDVGAHERKRRVGEVIEELGLSQRAGTPVGRLSGGERKRVSVGLELLTAPSLLLLDEPTSGLDPHAERSLVELFRTLADNGRTVIVATHGINDLRLYDRVLMLAPGGRLAYFGPPQMILAYFERSQIADAYQDLGEKRELDWGARFREHPYYAAYVERDTHEATVVEGARREARAGVRGRWHQFVTLTRRYLAVIAADRRNLALLIAQAPLLGLLLLIALPGGQLRPASSSQLQLVSQASLVLLVVVLGVSWLGMSNAVREIAKERGLYQRERAAGVSPVAYLASKAVVLALITIIQAVVLVLLATAAQHGPAHAVLLGWPVGELIVMGALAGVAAMAIGLLISALAKSSDRATTVLPIVLVFLLVLALGGVFPQIGNKPVLKQLGYIASTRWGFAGLASTADLNNLQAVTGVLTRDSSVNVQDPSALFAAFRHPYRGDPLWEHSAGAWLGDAGALIALTVLALMAAWLALVRDRPGT